MSSQAPSPEPRRPGGLPPTKEWPAVPPAPTPVFPNRPYMPPPPPVHSPGPVHSSMHLAGAATNLTTSSLTTNSLTTNSLTTSSLTTTSLTETSLTATSLTARSLTARSLTAIGAPNNGGNGRPALLAIPTATSRAVAPLRLRPVRPAAGPGAAWPARFATWSAGIIASGLAAITLPLWIAFYRGVGSGASVPAQISLSMMIFGCYFAGAALWLVLTEARVNHFAGAGPHPPTPSHLRPPADPFAEPATATAKTETPAPRPAAGSGGSLPAQIATLAVALVLFIGTILLSRP